MSFNDIYTATPGSPVAGNAPGLPPIDLPKSERQPLRVTVRPEPEVSPWASKQKPYEDTNKAEPEVSPWASQQKEYSEEGHEKIKQEQHIGTGEAALRGVGAGVSFGFAPFLEGLAAASGEPEPEGVSGRASGSAAARPIKGLINLLKEHGAGIEGPAMQAFRQKRDEEQAKLEESRRQHPIATFGGEVGGSLLARVPGQGALSQGASLLDRIVRGVVVGGVGGTLYGAGTSASKGEDADQALGEIAGSGIAGAGFGSLLHGAIGPRLPRGNTPGHIAQGVAEQLGTPLPRGLVSDNPVIQSTTSKLRSVPLLGSGISGRVQNFERAVGENVAGMASGTRGVAPNRDLAGASLRTALGDVIERNHQQINNAYDALNQVSQTHLFGSRNATAQALDAIRRGRRGARAANPDAGLANVINIIQGGQGGTFGGGISFRGLQRARSVLGEMLRFPEQHPGFNVGDGRRLYAAMSQDMEDIVRRHARPGIHPNQAAAALQNAHRVAADNIERNNAIQRILNSSSNERLVGSLVSAAQERGGNLQLLRQLRTTMNPQDFEHIGGVIMSELGRTGNGEFSLIKMLSGWNHIRNAAPDLFSPQHLAALNNILTAGRHIRGALSESNVGKSETAGVIILFDLAKDAIMFGAAAGAGTLATGSWVGAAFGAPVAAFSYWLSRPAIAQSMSRWVTAYRAMTLGVPTPARRAAFNIATRNLANMLGVPAEAIAARALGQQQPSSRASLPIPRQSPASTNTGSRVAPTAGSLSPGR